MFLSNWLVFKIVLAAVTGLVDYPLAADVLLKYDDANKLYLEGNSIDYVSNVVLYKGETSYTLGTGDILNKTTTTAYEVVLPSSSVHGTFGINQDATRYVHQYPEASGYQNGKFQVYSGTPSDGYTEYGSEIQPFNGDEIILCSMSADGKYILVTNYNGGFADGYKMYKDNGSEYVYHSSYACIGSSTNNDTGYKPAFVPSNNNFVITGTGGGSNSDDFYFKLYVYDPLTETWTGKTTVYSLNAPTGDAQRGLFGKLFTYDGKYLMMSDNGTPTRGEVYEVDWDANTMVNVWYTTEGSDGDGAGGAISPDNRYVVLARHDGNPYRVYENMSGDWSTVENVTSQFDLTGSGTGTIFGGYGIEFSGYSSENTTPLYIGQVSYHGDGKFRLENWAKRSPYEMYITQPGTYRADLQICGIDYKTNTVEVTGTPSDIEVFKEPETNFSTSNALFSQNGFYTASGSSDATYLLIHPTSTSITVYKGTPDNGYTSYYTDSTNVNINPATMSHDGLYIVKRSSANTIDLYKHNTSTQTYVKTSGKFSTPYDVYKIGFLPNSYDFGYTVTNGSNESVLYLHKYNSGDTWDTPTSINLTSIYSLSTSANYGRYGISFSKKDTNGNCLLAFADSFASSNELYILNVNWNTMSTSLVRSINTSVSYSWTVSFTRDGVYLWIAQSSGATRQMFKSTDNWVSYEDVTSSFTNSQYLGSHTTTFLKEYVIGAHYENPVSGIEDVIRLYKWQDLISPTLTFDGYNQLSLTNTPTYTSSKLTYGSNVYDIGTLTSDITIERPGEYASLTFDTSSNVAYFSNATVGAMGTTLADYVVDTTIYGTVQSGQTHQIGQGGFGNNTILNADGTRLLITDPLNYPSGRGRAYIYHLENGSWVLKQTWDNPNNTGQRFADGACMNEDGTRIFLMHNASEKVYTYEYTNGAWPTDNTGTHVITVGTNIGAEYEGLACNKAGDVLLMGHGNANTAYIYRRASATSWSQDSGGSFTKGRGVAMNGDGTRAFIGNSTDGTVHMTEWNGSTWSSLTQIIDESYSNWPCTMMSDSVGETLVIVSGNGDSSSGNSGIYERDSGTGLWSRAQGVNADTEIYGMRLPSISYDGTMVLVGSFRYDSSKGRAQLWQKSNGAWTLKKEYLNPDTSPASSDQFGAGCGIARTTKDKFVIGMEGDDTAGTDYGSVYVYNNTIPDFISFDTYNKLSLSGLTNPTSKIHALLTGAETTTVYDIGTATNIYIESEGTYTAEMKGSDGFALVSNVVGTGQISEPPVYSSATPTLVDPIDITDGIWSSLTYQWYQTHSTYYLYKLSGDPNDSDRFIKYDWVNLVWSDQDQSGTYSTFGTSATDTTATARSITNPTHIYLMAGSQLHATMVIPYYQVPNYSPSLTHDTYNNLSIENITPTASTLRLGSNTYDIGTATDIYIQDTGTYEIETKDANTFALVSNVVTGTIKTIEPGFASRYQGSMALTYDGKLYAWGMNGDGEAGVGTSSDITVPTLCTGITQGTVAKLLSSSDITENSRGEVSVIKTTDGKIYMAGKGDNYCIPGKTSDQTSFIDVTSYFGDQSLTANTITMMSFTDRSGTALTETGNVWTWGTHDSTYKALGQAGASSSSTPKQINFSSATDNITKVTCGHYHSLALDSSGDVWFWGKNGINSDSWPSSITDEPQKVVDGKNIIGIASSYGNMYAWDATGKMWNAGNNWEGQIGDGTTTTNTTGKTLTEVTYFSSNNITINKVYGGGYFVFADTSDGYYCWGSGYHGNFGNGSTGNLESPTKWTNVSNIKKFMASTNHATAITEDGKYYAWGAGTNYARGDNDTGDISYPKYIDTLPNILAPSFEFDGYDKVFVYNIDHLLAVPVFPNQLEHVSGALYGTYSWRYYETTSTHIIYMMYNDTTSAFFDVPVSAIQVGLYGQPDYDTWTDAVVAVSNHPNSVTENSDGTVTLDYSGTSYSFVKPTNAYWHWKLDPIKTVKFSKNAIEYDANKAQIVTISDSGTYDAQLSQGSTFSLKSTTIPATKASGLYTWAFHHGNFDNAYGDGDILTARDNGRFYADTPSYTGDIGTITAGSSTTSNTTYTFTPASTLTANVLMVAGGGGGGGRYNCGGGGAGGLVYTVGTVGHTVQRVVLEDPVVVVVVKQVMVRVVPQPRDKVSRVVLVRTRVVLLVVVVVVVVLVT